jgi:hypothetical protein
LVEFALLLPLLTLLLLGMLEFGFLFDHHISLGYASREGARVGSALANGGGPLGCGSGKSPNASLVDPQIVAAVQRVLTSPGSLVDVGRIREIRIFRASAAGAQLGNQVNVWTYAPGGGPEIDGRPLDFAPDDIGWPACGRSNRNPPDSIGVSVAYSYDLSTGLGSLLRFFGGAGGGTVQMSDQTVMALNPTDL